MSQATFENPILKLTLSAHEDADRRLLLIEAVAAEREPADQEPPINVAVVIDRSGSMAGRKLDAVKEATAKLIRSLRPSDRVALVAYDNRVQVLADRAQPSEGVARLVDVIRPGGSTDLYSGWLQGAKLVTGGGHVILLSDGLANAGPYTGAAQLAEHAATSRSRYGVSTSTVGVGSDYDEALMSSMAQAGQGFHYFANDGETIIKAFSRERFLIGTLSLTDARLSWRGGTIELGNLLSGEKKGWVTEVQTLPAWCELTYVDAKTEERVKAAVEVPKSFGHHPLATAYLLSETAARLLEKAIHVRSQDSAERLAGEVETLIVAIGNHELSNEDPLTMTLDQLRRASARLRELQEDFSTHAAAMESKGLFQRAHSIRQQSRAFYGDTAEDRSMSASRSRAFVNTQFSGADPAAFAVQPVTFWIDHKAVPLKVHHRSIVVGVVDPFDGFAISALARAVGLGIETDKRPWTEEEILKALEAYR